MSTRLLRELPAAGHEVMLELGACHLVTVYVLGNNAFIPQPENRSTGKLLQSEVKKKEVAKLLYEEFEVSMTIFPVPVQH